MKRLLIAAALCLAGMAHSQEIVGQAIVDGRIVNLFDNQTWAYSENVDQSCRAVTARVQFCGSQDTWTPIELDNADVAAGFRHDDRHYAQFIIEEIGTDDGLSPDVMRQIVIDNAASASNKSPSEIPVLEVTETTLSGEAADTMVYIGDIDGFSFVFANTMYLASDFSMQVISFAVSDSYSDKHRTLHANPLEATEVMP